MMRGRGLIGLSMLAWLSGCATRPVEVPVLVPTPVVPAGVLETLQPVAVPVPGELETNGALAEYWLEWVAALAEANGRIGAARRLLMEAGK